MKLQVIVGSTRPGRVTDRVATWVAAEAKNLPDTTVEVVDLANYALPFLDEEISPQYNPNRKPAGVVKEWLDKLTEADAYVLVTPEYNRSYSAVLKNALDYVDFQLQRKPVALVGHGTTGGAQAIAHLRGVIPGVLGAMVPHAVYLTGRAGDMMDQAGNLQAELLQNPYGPQGALKRMLEELHWYGEALAAARAKA